MAVRIGIDRSPQWRDMGSGVSLLMRPATSIEFGAAERAARDKVQAVMAGAAAFSEIGLEVATPAQLSDPYWIIGVTRWLVASALAARLVDDWRGVLQGVEGEDEATGEAAALSPAGLADLLRYESIQKQFEAHAYQVMEAVGAEGKKSPPPPAGSAAEAAPTAEPAGKTASPALAASAGETESSAPS